MAEHANRRLVAALALIKQLCCYPDEPHVRATRRAAWTLLQKVAAKALAYDVRTLDTDAVMPLAEQLRDAALNATRVLAGAKDERWTDDQREQVRWPADMGGMDLGCPVVAAQVGRIACLAQILPVVRSHLARILPELPQAEILAAVPLDSVMKA